MKNENRSVQTLGVTLAALLAASIGLAGCGKDAAESTVSMSFASYTAQNLLYELLVPSVYAGATDVKMCFKRLRFKQEGEETSSDSSQDEDNIDLQLGQVSLSTSGTSLGEVTLPAATYKRIEFDLEKDCEGTTANSLEAVTTGAGSSLIVTEDRITIKFEGTFEANETNENLAMSVDLILDAIDAAASGGDLKTAAEGASGSY